MKARNTILIVLSVLVGAAGARAYVLHGPKWYVQQVPYYINPVNSDVSEVDATTAIQAAGLSWTAQSNANILLEYAGRTSGSTITRNARNEVFFRNSGGGGILGETYAWWEGDRFIEFDVVLYDSAITFFGSNSACSGGVYLQDTATHEFGHALGLGHSTVAGAIMYPVTPWCSASVRSLHADDIAGVEALYSTSNPSNVPPSVTIATPPSGSTISYGTATTFSGSASDREDGNVTSSLVWTSSIDGQIGTGGTFIGVLSAGSHVITASASDSRGLVGSRQISVLVTSPPPPSPQITSIVKTPASTTMGGTPITLSVSATGGPLVYQYWRYSYTFGSWTLAQPWTTLNEHLWTPSILDGGWHKYQVWVRGAGATGDPAHWMEFGPFFISSPTPRVLSLSLSRPGAVPVNSPVTVTALATAGMSGLVEYQFWRYNTGTRQWSLDRPWSSNNSYSWTPAVSDEGVHALQVWVRELGQSAWQDWASTEMLVSSITATSVTPYTAVVVRGHPVNFSVAATGSNSGYEYKFLRYSVPGNNWTLERDYASSSTFEWLPTTAALGDNYFQIWVRRAGSSAIYAAWIQSDVIRVQ